MGVDRWGVFYLAQVRKPDGVDLPEEHCPTMCWLPLGRKNIKRMLKLSRTIRCLRDHFVDISWLEIDTDGSLLAQLGAIRWGRELTPAIFERWATVNLLTDPEEMRQFETMWHDPSNIQPVHTQVSRLGHFSSGSWAMTCMPSGYDAFIQSTG